MSLDHITASPSRTHVECRPNLGKVHLETSAPERSAAHLTTDSAADDMTEPSVARQSICDATEQMRCDRASATGRPTYKTLDSGQLTMQQIVENVEHITERETSWLNVRHSRSECRVQAIDIDRDVNTLDTFP
ncbi:hypothetical protein BHM03_00051716 [Ensete ventricosum]|nr:hypothetical protein BHM03_00051716 [Ensete ventricosum]